MPICLCSSAFHAPLSTNAAVALGVTFRNETGTVASPGVFAMTVDRRHRELCAENNSGTAGRAWNGALGRARASLAQTWPRGRPFLLMDAIAVVPPSRLWTLKRTRSSPVVVQRMLCSDTLTRSSGLTCGASSHYGVCSPAAS